jgi:hypothetical protein
MFEQVSAGASSSEQKSNQHHEHQAVEFIAKSRRNSFTC